MPMPASNDAMVKLCSISLSFRRLGALARARLHDEMASTPEQNQQKPKQHNKNKTKTNHGAKTKPQKTETLEDAQSQETAWHVLVIHTVFEAMSCFCLCCFLSRAKNKKQVFKKVHARATGASNVSSLYRQGFGDSHCLERTGGEGGREQYEESWMPKMQHVRHAMQGVPFVLCGSIVVIWRAPREHDEQ